MQLAFLYILARGKKPSGPCYKNKTTPQNLYAQSWPRAMFLMTQAHYRTSYTLALTSLAGIKFVRCGVRTHAPLREPDLKSSALDLSANLTCLEEIYLFALLNTKFKQTNHKQRKK